MSLVPNLSHIGIFVSVLFLVSFLPSGFIFSWILGFGMNVGFSALVPPVPFVKALVPPVPLVAPLPQPPYQPLGWFYWYAYMQRRLGDMIFSRKLVSVVRSHFALPFDI